MRQASIRDKAGVRYDNRSGGAESIRWFGHDAADMDLQTVGTGIAAVAAAASAYSAYTNRQAVDRANRAFVWPTISLGGDPDGRRVVRVRLQNDGAGTAYDVRWALGSMTVDANDKPLDDTGLTESTVSSVIRALRPGETLPPPDAGWLERALPPAPHDDVWWIVVRWTDASRVRWELSEQGPTLLRSEPRRLRTWTWQVWRSKRGW